MRVCVFRGCVEDVQITSTLLVVFCDDLFDLLGFCVYLLGPVLFPRNTRSTQHKEDF